MAVSNIDGFLETLRKSGLVEEAVVSNYMDQLRDAGGIPSDSKTLAQCMVRDALLSQFQSDQLVAGKWRGFHVAKYRVLEKIGIGGMGQVYLAEHKYMKHRVALKVLPRSKSSDPSSLERFYREAKAGAAMDHPNLVRAYDIDYDQSSDLHYLVMEYVDGVSMQDLVKLKGPLEAHRAAHYIYQACLGLQHAHEQGLIHRDIKPSNLLVDRQGTLKILDMGLARFFNDDQDMITKKYDENVLGTADYLAPEQAVDSHAVDVRADIYSLGCTFYFILSGQAPFGDGSVAQKLIWHQTRKPKSIREYRPDLPEDIYAILDKMMAKSPAERYQSPQEVADALLPYGQMNIPPPDEDELPQLSPLARMNPASSDYPGGPEKAPTPSSSHRQQKAPHVEAVLMKKGGDVDISSAESDRKMDVGAMPTKSHNESGWETLPPGKPAAKLARSGPQRFEGITPLPPPRQGPSQSPPVKRGSAGFEIGPISYDNAPGASDAPTVRTFRPNSRPEVEIRSVPTQPSSTEYSILQTDLSKYRWVWIVIGTLVVILIAFLNIYLLTRPY